MQSEGRARLHASSLIVLASFVSFVSFVLLASLAGCSKDDAPPVRKVQMLGDPRTVAPTPATPPPAADDDNAPSPPDPQPHAVIGGKAEPQLYYTVKIGHDASVAAVDPDLAVIAQGRVASARCFTGITDGSRSRSATIQVTVLPSGTVNRSEVSSGSTTEAWILSCLEGVGSGLHFSDKPAADIRTYSIGVTVTLGH